jgi:hypothetical protein
MKLSIYTALFWLGCTCSLVAIEPLQLGTRLELFVDDYLIQQASGDVARQLNLPEPQEVVLTTDAPWEGNTSAYYTIFRDREIYRMFYRGSHFDESTRQPGHREVTCYAESRDGIQWTKPELGLFEFAGSTRNNIVWDGIGTHCFAVFKDSNPNCSEEARYKAIARGQPLGQPGLYIFHSPDAIHWQLTHPEPVITEGAFDSQNIAFWDDHSGIYREYHRAFVKGVRSIMTCTSDDYLNWSAPKLLEYPDSPAEHLYTNAIGGYPRAPHILLGFPTRFLPNEGQRVEPTFMASRDGFVFRRFLEPIIPETAPQDRQGNRSNYMAWGLVELPNRPHHLSVYATEAYYTGPDSRLRRFEYRQDGFVSMRGGAAGGQLLTRPIELTPLSERLVVNFRTLDSGGQLRVGLETQTGVPLDNFALEDCDPLRGDNCHAQVSWNGTADISALQGQTIRLRFELSQTDLFSLQFQPWLR